MPARNIDWVKIEQDYRAGILSVREIAREVGLSDAAIRKRAKANGWERDLTEQVRAKTRQLLVRSLASSQAGPQSPHATSDEISSKAAVTQVAVVRDHQISIHDAYSLTRRMLDELNATTSHPGELEVMIEAVYDDPKQRKAAQRAVSLPSRAAVMRDLATAARTWVGLERQAFGIFDESKMPPPQQTVNENQSIEGLKAEIMADLAELSITPQDAVIPSEPTGIANRPAKGNGTAH